MNPQRFALRFMLPAEILIGMLTFTWGLAGIFGSGRISIALDAIGHSLAWASMLAAVGIGQAIVAAVELMRGRDWSDGVLCVVADLRHFFGFLGVLIFLTAIGLIILYPPLRSSVSLQAQSVLLLVANVIVTYKNKQLAVLLDPTIPTTQLRQKLMEARTIRG